MGKKNPNMGQKGEKHHSWSGGGIKVKCAWCRKEFVIVKSRFERKKDKTFTCSYECKAKYYNGSKSYQWIGRKTVKCAWCGKEKDIPTSMNRKRYFCNKACQGLWKSENLTGENSGTWRDGKSKEPYPVGWNNCLKNKIRERDDFICQMCGKKQRETGKKLFIHHIDYDKNNLNSDNLISLCNSCHGKTHGNRANWIKHFQTIMNRTKVA